MHDRWSKQTASGLPILKRSAHLRYVRFDRCDDLGLFSTENDHNPLVAATCPDCHGVGQWCRDDPESGAHYYCGCPRCDQSGVIDEPARLFENDRPPEVICVDAEGRALCPGCGVRFRTTDRSTWTGWRHNCGQRLVVRQEVNDAEPSDAPSDLNQT